MNEEITVQMRIFDSVVNVVNVVDFKNKDSRFYKLSLCINALNKSFVF